MARRPTKSQAPELDLSDVDHRVGKPIGGGQLWDPCSSSDVRRWVMAMDYPNPLHWDKEFARESRFGGIVSPTVMLQTWYDLGDPTDEAAWWIRKSAAEHFEEHLPRLRDWVAEHQRNNGWVGEHFRLVGAQFSFCWPKVRSTSQGISVV